MTAIYQAKGMAPSQKAKETTKVFYLKFIDFIQKKTFTYFSCRCTKCNDKDFGLMPGELPFLALSKRG